MSPDDIFAANMWPWPDPMVKRDAMGRIIFVNAAFLQLYGGRVENWAGQILQGWAQPKPQGMAYRFETRAGAQPNEIIYDWVEITMGDGNALAIARDITLFRKTPTAPQNTQADASAMQGQAAPAPQAAMAAPEIAVAAPLVAPIFQEEESPEPVSPPFAEPELPAQTLQPEPVAQVAIEAPAPAPEPEIIQAQAPAPVMQQPEPAPVQPTAAPVQAAEPQAAPQISPAPEPAPEPEQVAAPEPAMQADAARDFERRALPIENNDAVLGSNWRDAVIAKAIGASEPKQDDEAEDAPSAGNPSEETPGEETPGQSLRILLAEDNAINALLTRTLLEAEGCSVETVEDGALAVKAAQANTYDLVFMDMRMPNMDGLEATRKIRALGRRTENLPIIALTANAFDDDRNACFDSGMNDFMTKPVSAEELSEMVATWTKKKAEMDAEKSA